MSTQQETVFKNRVRKDLEKFGEQIWICKTQQVSIRGTPDFLICLNGHFIALELKSSSKGKISDLQKYNLSSIRKAGGEGFIVYPANWEEILESLNTIFNWMNRRI